MKPEKVGEVLNKRLYAEDRRKSLYEAAKDISLSQLILNTISFDNFTNNYERWEQAPRQPAAPQWLHASPSNLAAPQLPQYVEKKAKKPRQQACQICRGYDHIALFCQYK